MSGAAERTVLCYGDSNTHGILATERAEISIRLPRPARWPGAMAAALGPGWHVIEEGLPGRTSVHDDPVEGGHRNGLTVLPALLDTHRPLDLVIIMLGTNDLKARFAVTAADIGRSLERLGRAVRLSQAGHGGAAPALILVAPPPIAEVGWPAPHFTGGAEKAETLAPEVAAAAARVGAGFFDAGAHTAVDPVDGIHLTEAGHTALGQGLASAARDLFGAPT